jgi:hypothetical protein
MSLELVFQCRCNHATEIILLNSSAVAIIITATLAPEKSITIPVIEKYADTQDKNNAASIAK